LNDGDIVVIFGETIFEQKYICFSKTKPALVSKISNEVQLERRAEYVSHDGDDMLFMGVVGSDKLQLKD
jgi:hypothetical protein